MQQDRSTDPGAWRALPCALLQLLIVLVPALALAELPQDSRAGDVPVSSAFPNVAEPGAPAIAVAATNKAKPEARGCRFSNRVYPAGSRVLCSTDPNDNRGCALGLPVAVWSCSDGRWVLSQSRR